MPSFSACHLTWVSLTLDMGHLFTAAPAKCSHCSLPWMRGISSWLLLLTMDVVVDVTGDTSKVQCCKEQYCIETWNVRSMNQGKLKVVKRKMARVNIDILGISVLRWTGMGEFNSDDYYIYYCGQESLRRNGVAIKVNKRVQNAVLGCNLKNDRMISVRFQGKPVNITVIQVYASPVMLKKLKLNNSMKTYKTP